MLRAASGAWHHLRLFRRCRGAGRRSRGTGPGRACLALREGGWQPGCACPSSPHVALPSWPSRCCWQWRPPRLCPQVPARRRPDPACGPGVDRVHDQRRTPSGVAATSARNAWAVGSTGTSRPRTLIVHWNGSDLDASAQPHPRRRRRPRPAVAAISGQQCLGGRPGRHAAGKTLILRWNGTTWKRVPSPSPGSGGSLSGVAAASARTAWAVGSTSTGSGNRRSDRATGTASAWKRVPSPSTPDSSLRGARRHPPAAPGRSAPPSARQASKP